MIPPRFVIVNSCDSPEACNVAEWKQGIGYCYMARFGRHMPRREFDGMLPARATAIEDFGLSVLVRGEIAYFQIAVDPIAQYEDGKPRRWQGAAQFHLPLVGRVRKVGSAIKGGAK